MILSFESEILLNVLKYLKNIFKKNNFIFKKIYNFMEIWDKKYY